MVGVVQQNPGSQRSGMHEYSSLTHTSHASNAVLFEEFILQPAYRIIFLRRVSAPSPLWLITGGRGRFSFSRVRPLLSFGMRECSSPTHSFHVFKAGLFSGWSILQSAAAHSLFLVRSAHPSSHLSFANSGEGEGASRDAPQDEVMSPKRITLNHIPGIKHRENTAPEQ